jgi:hypothetical protein
MSTNNTKTVASAPTLLARLAQAKAAKQSIAATAAKALRAQLEAAVGALHSLPALEAVRSEARASLEGEDLTSFESEVDRLIQVRKDLERVEAEAKRLALVSTPTALQGYLDRKVEVSEKAKEEAKREKELANKAAEKQAREEEIAKILAQMGEGKSKPLTDGQKAVLVTFLRGNPQWKFTPTPVGKNALLAAAEAASAAFRKANQLKAREQRAAQAEKAEAEKAAAPLTHNIKV